MNRTKSIQRGWVRMRVAVVTDSMADLPKETADEHGVSIVP